MDVIKQWTLDFTSHGEWNSHFHHRIETPQSTSNSTLNKPVTDTIHRVSVSGSAVSSSAPTTSVPSPPINSNLPTKIREPSPSTFTASLPVTLPKSPTPVSPITTPKTSTPTLTTPTALSDPTPTFTASLPVTIPKPTTPILPVTASLPVTIPKPTTPILPVTASLPVTIPKPTTPILPVTASSPVTLPKPIIPTPTFTASFPVTYQAPSIPAPAPAPIPPPPTPTPTFTASLPVTLPNNNIPIPTVTSHTPSTPTPAFTASLTVTPLNPTVDLEKNYLYPDDPNNKSFITRSRPKFYVAPNQNVKENTQNLATVNDINKPLFQPAVQRTATHHSPNHYGYVPTVPYRNAQVMENLLSNGRVGIDQLYRDLVMRRRMVNFKQ